jgi:hypothetical protein
MKTSKKHISMKEVTRRYEIVISTGYCDLQRLFQYEVPQYYNAGVYGWNCDVYTFWHNGKSIAVTTGYRNMKGTQLDYNTARKYDAKAHDILYCDTYSSQDKKREISSLLNSFLDYCVNM